MKLLLLLGLVAGTVSRPLEVCDQIANIKFDGQDIRKVSTPFGTFQECCDTCRSYDGCIAFVIWDKDKNCQMLSSVKKNKTSNDGHSSGVCHRTPTPAPTTPPPTPPTPPPTFIRNPPDTPPQFTAIMGTKAAPRQVYSDAATTTVAVYSSGGKAYEIDECGDVPLIFSNAGAIPGLSPPGPCTCKPPSPYSSPCPSALAPGWPPTAQDFYAGYQKRLSYNETVPCPTSTGTQCDRYWLDLYHDGYETFNFFVDVPSQVPIYGVIKVGATIYEHSLTVGVDPAMLAPPASCPDITGPCAICYTGVCGPCQACLGQPKTGQCAACWAPDAASGYSCMSDDPKKDLCDKCWTPGAEL